jgi:hypothetical protein
MYCRDAQSGRLSFYRTIPSLPGSLNGCEVERELFGGGVSKGILDITTPIPKAFGTPEGDFFMFRFKPLSGGRGQKEFF